MWIEIAAWTVLVVGIVTGVAGVLLPVLPGALLIALGALVHKLLLPEWLSWWTVGGLIFLSIVERLLDFVGTMMGARKGGATKWGVFGAAVGGIVGLFFIPFGLILGPVIGAFVAELIVARRHPGESWKAGLGAGIGIGVSTLARLALSIFMVMIIISDLAFFRA